MAYTDPNYSFLQGGSTAVSAATTFTNLFGNWQGLSALNASEIIILNLATSSGQTAVVPVLNSLLAANMAYFLTPSGILQTYPVPAITASQTGLVSTGTNLPTVYWSVWVRNPL